MELASDTSNASKVPLTDEDKKHPNPYIEVLNKKIRALRKRLAKIQASEEALSQGKPLDEAQKANLAKKPEIELMLSQFDEIEKSFIGVEQEILKNEKKLQKKRKNDELKAQQAAKEREDLRLKEFLEVIYLLSQFGQQELRQGFLDGSLTANPLNESNLSLLDQVQLSLFPKYSAELGLNAVIEEAFKHGLKLLESANDNFSETITYQNIRQIVDLVRSSRFFDLQVARAEALALEQEAAALAAAEALRIAQEQEAARLAQIEETFVVLDPKDLPAPSDTAPDQVNGTQGIQFMNDSELDEPTTSTQPTSTKPTELPPSITSNATSAAESAAAADSFPEPLQISSSETTNANDVDKEGDWNSGQRRGRNNAARGHYRGGDRRGGFRGGRGGGGHRDGGHREGGNRDGAHRHEGNHRDHPREGGSQRGGRDGERRGGGRGGSGHSSQVPTSTST